MKNKIIRIINICLLLLCMMSIFLFSCENSNESTNTSVETTKVVIDTITFNQLEESKSEEIANTYFTPIRKSAHVIEFFCLGLLVINVVKDYWKINYKLILLCILFCMMYAVSDELHQHFVPGRSCEFKDVCIDTIGSSVGIMIYYLIGRIKLVLKN